MPLKERDFSSCIVAIAVDSTLCVKVVSLYPIRTWSIFALFLIHTLRRARGLGEMTKKIVTALVVHVMDLICFYLS